MRFAAFVIVLICWQSIIARAVYSKVYFISSGENISVFANGEVEIETSDKLQNGAINLRMVSGRIEVYNYAGATWLPMSGVTASAPMDRKLYLEAYSLSDCPEVRKVSLQLDNSTPSASVYVDSFNEGKTRRDGTFEKTIGGRCANKKVSIKVSKSKCEDFEDAIDVSSNPFVYRKSVNLKCGSKK